MSSEHKQDAWANLPAHIETVSFQTWIKEKFQAILLKLLLYICTFAKEIGLAIC